MKTFFATVGAVAAVLGVPFGLAYYGYIGTAFFAPRYEAIRRDTMIESRYYSEATIRRLRDLKIQYDASSDSSARLTLAAAAKHEAAIFPQDRLPADLRLWLSSLGG